MDTHVNSKMLMLVYEGYVLKFVCTPLKAKVSLWLTEMFIVVIKQDKLSFKCINARLHISYNAPNFVGPKLFNKLLLN